MSNCEKGSTADYATAGQQSLSGSLTALRLMLMATQSTAAGIAATL